MHTHTQQVTPQTDPGQVYPAYVLQCSDLILGKEKPGSL